MSKLKAIALVLALTLSVSVFTACGSKGEAPSSQAGATSTATEQGGSKPKVEKLTSSDKKVVTLNGELSKMETPVYVTSVGQSADVSMLDALMKKVGAEYTFNSTAKAADLAGAKTVIICAGASSKGLGAAGISADDEKARAKEILTYCTENKINVIMAHLGGVSRRGALSDEFSEMVMESSASILMVEDGNDDGKFSDFAKEKNIPITLVNTIADCMEPLKTMFAK